MNTVVSLVHMLCTRVCVHTVTLVVCLVVFAVSADEEGIKREHIFHWCVQEHSDLQEIRQSNFEIEVVRKCDFLWHKIFSIRIKK